MSNFTTRNFDKIKAREIVDELCINGLGQMDLLEKSLKGTTFNPELKTLIRYIQHFADGGNIGSKLVILENPTYGLREFEFKSEHLRVYAFQMPNRKILVSGGIKHHPKSKDTIDEFRSIKERYLIAIKYIE